MDIELSASAPLYEGLSQLLINGERRDALSGARGLNAGAVWLNAHLLTDPSMPFGGFKQSEWGRENGEQGLSALLETKSIYAVL